MASRSLVPLTLDDLRRLGAIAAADRETFFARHPGTAALYRQGPFAVALCQGGAQHFLDGFSGIKDFDVWSFYQESPVRMFPPRRIGKADLGDPKFGRSEDSPQFIGRRVDLIGRSIQAKDVADPVHVLRSYLRSKKTLSAKLLSHKAMILIEPPSLLGTVVWPE